MGTVLVLPIDRGVSQYIGRKPQEPSSIREEEEVLAWFVQASE